ncbi:MULTISPECIES: hypothetical protein [unclassified Polaromonas]|uniref:hypothetical protein n=1 Tax=unclassified Polaromonas TaxID=2638319 RepID=UPI000F08620D|nr:MULTISPECIES: hypothetical protein [unclassified Polaromonas]AYQ28841.1 hypothetical protein DT070_12900 [Polaromonas sp. SP1]QGJ20043.1 hypothetical protein F7R28_17705 [Polaromonas sp. Pch-P]
MTPQQQLDAIHTSLQQLRSGQLGAAAFSQLAAQQQSLAAALPGRFNDVLSQLLNGLESSALFTEESCSFSQTELLDSLQLWIDKAGLQLQKG